MRKINVPCLIILLVLVIAGLACVFSPTIAAWYVAGSQDGFTLDAFDFSPNPLWDVGLLWGVFVVAVGTVVLWKVWEAGKGR